MLFLEHFTHDSSSAEDHAGDGKMTGEVESAASGVHKPTCPDIRLQELQTFIQSLKNTSPGNDLISNAFLRRIPDYFINELLSLFNTSFVNRVVPTMWKQGVICSILKPGKGPTQVNSY
jgi:hypothetical protein